MSKQSSHMLSRTKQRAYLYLTLALLIAAILILWRAPQNKGVAVSGNVDSLQQVEESATYSREYRNHGVRYASRGHGSSPSASYGYESGGKAPAHDVDTSYRSDFRPYKSNKKLVVDINTADTLTLQLLNGIGPAYASRIVRYRQRLGGFVSVGQLLEVYGFTTDKLDRIAANLTLTTDSIRLLNPNTATLKQLSRHPYIDYYQARDIVAVRNTGVRFNKTHDMLLVPSVSDSDLVRLAPYLTFR